MDKRLYLPAGPLGISIHGYHLPAHLADGTPVNGPHIAAPSPTLVHSALGWPSRLFEIADWKRHGKAGSVIGFRVIEEHPGHLMLGPNGRKVQEILDEAPGHVFAAGPHSTATASRRCHAYIEEARERGLTAAVSIIEQATLGDISRTLHALSAVLELTDDAHGTGDLGLAFNMPHKERLA